jgi:hypothetical protein
MEIEWKVIAVLAVAVAILSGEFIMALVALVVIGGFVALIQFGGKAGAILALVILFALAGVVFLGAGISGVESGAWDFLLGGGSSGTTVISNLTDTTCVTRAGVDIPVIGDIIWLFTEAGK